MTKIQRNHCSYYNPCSAKHAQAVTLYQKLDSGKKCLVILATLFAALGTFFMGGLGGCAAFRHLVYKWSKKDKKDTSQDSSTEKTAQLGENKLALKEKSKPAVKTEKVHEEVSELRVEKAQKTLRDYFKKDSETKYDVSILRNSHRTSGFVDVNLDPNDLAADFLIKALMKSTHLMQLIQISSITRLLGEFTGISINMKMTDYLNEQDHFIKNQYGQERAFYVHMTPDWLDKVKDVSSELKRDLLRAQKYFQCLLGLQAADIPMDPFQLKEVVELLDQEMRDILEKYNDKDFNTEEFQKIKPEIKKLRNLVFWLTYPLKLFTHLYELHGNSSSKIDPSKEILAYRDKLVQEWMDENSRSLVFQV